MGRFFKFLFSLVIFLVILVVAAVILIPMLVDPNDYKAEIAAEVKKATGRDLEMLEQLCGLLKETSLCGLGQTAPNPVVSTLRYFRDEYLAHIEERRCPAGVCPVGKSKGTAAATEVRA